MTGTQVRSLAFLLSLVVPGAGHFLRGAFRRGVAWAVGLTVVGFAVLLTIPISLVMFLIGVVFCLRVAAAIDAVRISAVTPPWRSVLLGWGALLVATVLVTLFVEAPLRTYYEAHYAEAFTIPSGGMMPTLLVGDAIMVDKSAYRSRVPERGVFRFPRDERKKQIKRIIGMPGEQILIRGAEVFVNGEPLREPYVMPRQATPQPLRAGRRRRGEPGE